MKKSNSQKDDSKRTKGLKDLFSKVVYSFGDSSTQKDGASSKEMLNSVLNWAGKSRDEFIQMVSREAGQALATTLEPLLQNISSFNISKKRILFK